MQKLLIKLTVLVALFTPITAATVYAANCQNSAADAITCGVQSASGNNQSPSAAVKQTNDTISSIVNVASAVVGVAALFMLIYGGFKYITSAGDEAGAKAARNTIVYAIIGLIIVALAQIIVKFVIRNVGS